MTDRIERFQAPTLEKLKDLPCDDETREKIRAILAEDGDPCEADLPPLASYEVKLAAIDGLLETSGIESLNFEGAPSYTDEGIRMCPPFSYCNAGDPYIVTLLRDHKEGAWVVGCWADLAEEYEKEEKIGDFEEFDEAPEQCPSCGESDTFSIKSYEPGEHTPEGWKGSGTLRYYFECSSCGHHCKTPEGFEPSSDENEEEIEDTCSQCGALPHAPSSDCEGDGS